MGRTKGRSRVPYPPTRMSAGKVSVEGLQIPVVWIKPNQTHTFHSQGSAGTALAPEMVTEWVRWTSFSFRRVNVGEIVSSLKR